MLANIDPNPADFVQSQIVADIGPNTVEGVLNVGTCLPMHTEVEPNLTKPAPKLHGLRESLENIGPTMPRPAMRG